MFSIDQVGQVWEEEKKIAYADRMQYADVYDIVEQYVSRYNATSQIIIGGAIGINMLLKKERSLDDFTYELYTENAFLHANDLVNEIARELTAAEDPDKVTSAGDKNRVPPRIPLLKTMIPLDKYSIIVDNRPLISIISLGNVGQKINIISIIEPLNVKTFNAKYDVLVLSPEMQLIDIYRTLYSPQYVDSWELSIHDEAALFQHILPTLEASPESVQDAQESLRGQEQDPRKKIQLLILHKFIQNNQSLALIGEHALFMLDVNQKENLQPSSFIVQLISSRSPEEDFADLQDILAGTPISKAVRQLHIMQDFRILRTTIRTVEDQKEIAYIYNSAQYDLIPVTRIVSPSNDFIQIGNPFVLIRFLLIDLWMLRWVAALGAINERYQKLRIAGIMHRILYLRNALSPKGASFATVDVKHPFMNIFQTHINDYIGTYDDEIISQKEKIKDQRKFRDYYPQEYFARNNSYRQISHSDSSLAS